MDPLSIALMAVNVGASVFNNLRNNKQSRNLQIMQQEYTKAATERNTQRMWQLMREGQKLAIELERESQDYRLEEIAKEFDNLLERMTYSEAIKLWPLKVLPIVMKNQSLGSAIGHGTEHIALHCILTPTNCEKFNKLIFPDIEEQLSDFFNLHWNTSSSHPILFYSGAWKSRTVPTGVEIKHLSVDLSKLPVLLITPFFKPEGGLLFQIRAWGIGVELDTEIECSDFSYAEKYKCGINYQDEKDIAERSIEEIIPYLQCLIGYIADQYFWACHNESPLLPTLLTMNIVNTDGMPYLKSSSEERYCQLLKKQNDGDDDILLCFRHSSILSLMNGLNHFLSPNLLDEKAKEMLLTIYSDREINTYNTISELISSQVINLTNIQQIEDYTKFIQDPHIRSALQCELIKVKENTPKRRKRNAISISYGCTEQTIEEFRLDLILEDFINYTTLNQLKKIDLLITQQNFREFVLHTYDSETDEILYYRCPFNKIFKARRVCNLINIKDLFHNGALTQIACSLERINVLKDKILSTTLIY